MKRLFFVLLLAGCTMSGSGSNVAANCVDTRDGETFTTVEDTISNVRIGIGADSCADVLDIDGNVRTMCTSDNAWLKCKPVEGDERSLAAYRKGQF